MLKSKLILLEGIPGSGKSSAAAFIQDLLAKNGIPSRFWREGDFDNPADFEGVACVSGSVFQDLLSRYPQLAHLFQAHLTTRGDDYLLSYRKMHHLHPQEVPEVLVNELSAYDVYDGLPLKDYCRLALQRWSDFTQSTKNSDEVTILECCFLQNPLTVMLARHDADLLSTRKQIAALASIIRELDPLVVYLYPKDVRATLEHVRAERPKEWADFVTWYLTGQAYGKNHNQSGFEGVIKFYEMRQAFETLLLQNLPVKSLIVDNSDGDWDRCYKEISEFILST